MRSPAVQRCQHDAGEACADIAFQLRRQVNFRHHDEDLRLRRAFQHFRARLQIHFRLAAARHAIQQHGLVAVRLADEIRRRLLLRIQYRHVVRRGIVAVRQLGQLFQRIVERHGFRHAHILRHTGQRHFAQRTLVIIRGKAGQRQPWLRDGG
jgi:ribosomal protein S3